MIYIEYFLKFSYLLIHFFVKLFVFLCACSTLAFRVLKPKKLPFLQEQKVSRSHQPLAALRQKQTTQS
jgi:hypothetical protein